MPTKKHTKLLLFTVIIFSTTFNAFAESFNGVNFSGVYDCTGIDNHEGKYTGIVTLTLDIKQSINDKGAYHFKLEAPGYGIYLGEAAADGMAMAMHFALTDPTPKDFGTGIARFSKNVAGKWTFQKYYYEPEFKGGNYGTENCVMR